MTEFQIILVCLLAVLGIAFVIVLFVRFNENSSITAMHLTKKTSKVIDIFNCYDSFEDQWMHIWPLFFKDGEVNYQKIESSLNYIINKDELSDIHDKAIAILREKVAFSVFGDNEITEAIDEFRTSLNVCGQQVVKESGNKLIKKIQKYCKNNRNSKKYDLIIQWIFNAIEIVGLILAIVTL